jgi:hypothetical protein
MLFIAPQLFKRSAGAPYFSLPREWLDSARVIKVYFLSPQASNFFKILYSLRRRFKILFDWGRNMLRFVKSSSSARLGSVRELNAVAL